MFQNVEMAPADPILGLNAAFQQDTNPQKVNLGVGVFKDEQGNTPVLESVKAAEKKILETEKTKSYKPINGSPDYGLAVQKLLFGADHNVLSASRGQTAHCPGGTGALRVAGDYLSRVHKGTSIHISNPTWANHNGIFHAAGLETKVYDYYDPATSSLNFEGMVESIKQIPAGDVILLHGCCHNPTGVDPNTEQWATIADLLAEREILPLLDFAYQGFATGLREDAQGLHAIAAKNNELLICSSFSKNFSLYNERTGALTVVGSDADTAARVMSEVKRSIRVNYSNPPAHGGEIVSTILNDDTLRTQWESELADMRNRINGMRKKFVDALDAKGIKLNPTGNDFITHQNGMFSFSGLNKDQVNTLREKFSIYIVGSGRINVAGISDSNLDYFVNAISEVV